MNEGPAIISIVWYKVLPKFEGVSLSCFLASCKGMKLSVTTELNPFSLVIYNDLSVNCKSMEMSMIIENL